MNSKFKCRCGEKFKDFKKFSRHVTAKEFTFGCTLCPSSFTSYDHRVRHYRNLHADHDPPKSDEKVTPNPLFSSNEHFSTKEILGLRVRAKRSRKKINQQQTPISSSPAQPLQNDGDIDFLITQVSPSIPPLPTLSFADYIEIDDTDDIVTSATTPSPSLPPLPTLSFADYIDLDDTDDITTSATPSLARTILLQTPPSSPVMNYDLDN